MQDPTEDLKTKVIHAALPHVAFDGWSDATLAAALCDADVAPELGRTLFPRGAVDMALWFHQSGDRAMEETLKNETLADLKIRERVTLAVRTRIEVISDKEAVRRGTTLFALPIYAGDGAKALWGTADAIWSALGDPSTDYNWYTKRATLSGVYASTILFWLGDGSEGAEDTWGFLDRRIENVMQFEKTKAAVQSNPLMKTVFAGPMWVLNQVKAPIPRTDLPGRWAPDSGN